jgi:hypothetical protein
MDNVLDDISAKLERLSAQMAEQTQVMLRLLEELEKKPNDMKWPTRGE